MINYFINKELSKAYDEANRLEIESLKIDHLERLVDFVDKGAISTQELHNIKDFLLFLDMNKVENINKVLFFDENLKDVLHCFVLFQEQRIDKNTYEYIKKIRLTDPIALIKNDRKRASNEFFSDQAWPIPIRVIVENLSDFFNLGAISYQQYYSFLHAAIKGKNCILLDGAFTFGTNYHSIFMRLFH